MVGLCFKAERENQKKTKQTFKEHFPKPKVCISKSSVIKGSQIL